MTYFAAGLVRTRDGWTGRELDLDEVADFDALVDVLRDLAEERSGHPALLMLEEDDEWVGIARVDDIGDPRVFLSDARVTASSELAAVLAEEVDEPEPVPAEDEEESARPQAEPRGDPALLADLGTSGPDLLALCVEEGLLPADVIGSLCERAGCLDVLEELRGG